MEVIFKKTLRKIGLGSKSTLIIKMVMRKKTWRMQMDQTIIILTLTKGQKL
jgi:hypothetical protein